MIQNPLVTIICLCYNHGKYVVEALNSVLNQTYSPIQLIIADDCSNDDSVLIIAQWLKNNPDVLFIKNPINLGNTRTFNSLLKYAKGEFIIDLAADDLLLPNTVALQIETFQKSAYKKLGIVYGNVELIYPDGSHLYNFFKTDSNGKRVLQQPVGDIYLGLLSMQNNVCSVSSMVKKEVYDKLNGYDESLYYEDFDFWIRAARLYEFEFIDSIIFKKRELPSSLSAQRFKRFNSRAWKFNNSTYRMILKIINLNQSEVEKKAIIKMIQYEIFIACKTLNIKLFFKHLLLLSKLKLNLI